MIRGHGTAVVAVRNDEEHEPTDEMAGLARTAGYEVATTVAAVAPQDSTTGLPPSLVERARETAERHEADALLVGDDLTPTQAFELRERLPDGTEVVDRTRLVLAIFEDRAGTERARLETELARLEYELPRLRAAIRRDEATEITAHDEGGKPVEDRKRRIDAVRRKLSALDDPTARRQRERREAGFDLVALAGYTNAGKTTLLRRLADDLAVEDDSADDLQDGPATRDRLFETLGTTTRRATVAGRRTLVADTVGFVRNLPHELVASFEATLESAFAADVVCLVVDATDQVERVEEKVATCRETLADADTVVPVLNKVDAVDDDHLEAVGAVVGGDPVAVSAREGADLDALRDRIARELPAERATLDLPNCGDAMALVSWAHDHLAVESVEYGDRVTVVATGRPDVVAESRRRAARVTSDEAGGEDARVDGQQHGDG